MSTAAEVDGSPPPPQPSPDGRRPGPSSREGDGESSHEARARERMEATLFRRPHLRNTTAEAFFDSDCSSRFRELFMQDLDRGDIIRAWTGGVLFHTFSVEELTPMKKPLEFYWRGLRGPARVLLVDMPNTIWLSFRNNIVKASPERIWPASEEETQTLRQWLGGLTNLREQLRQPQNKGIIDLQSEPPPTQLNLVKTRRLKFHQQSNRRKRNSVLHQNCLFLQEPARRVKQKTSDYVPHEPVQPDPEPTPNSDRVGIGSGSANW